MSMPQTSPPSMKGEATSTIRASRTRNPDRANPRIDRNLTHGFVSLRISVTRWGTGTAASDKLRAPQIVQVDDPFDAPLPVHDHQGGDVLLFHETQCGGRQLRGADGDGRARHDVLGGDGERVLDALHQTAQVAVGDDAL